MTKQVLGMVCSGLIGLQLCAGAALAASDVKVESNRVSIGAAVTAEMLAEIKQGVGSATDLEFTFESVGSDADLAKLCEAFPDMKELNIDGPQALTSLAPMAKLKKLTSFTLNGGTVTDFSPLSDLTGLTYLHIDGNSAENGMMAPNLKWMSKLTNLTSLSIGGPSDLRTLVSFEGIPSLPKLASASFTGAAPVDLTPIQALPGLKELKLTGCIIADLTPLAKLTELKDLNLYGVTVKDFSPLAALPKLQKLTYYATEGADYGSLGKLTQVQELAGGLTEMADISWVAALPNLRKFDVFSEKITDYRPLAKAQVENLQIWSMKTPTDLKQLSGAVSLKRLKLWNLKDVSGFEGLSSLVNLEELILAGVKTQDGSVVNLAFAKSLVNLKKLEISASEISSFDAVTACAKLENVEIRKDVKGIAGLAALKKLPKLKAVVVAKGMFPDAELAGFNAQVKITQR